VLSNLIPTIQTDRLMLRAFARDDAADVFAYASNSNVSRHMPWETHGTIDDSIAFIDMVLARHPHEHTWAICERAKPTVIGAIEFGLKADTIAQLDYVLSETFWHRGLMSEAARAVIEWGWNHYPMVRRIVSCTLTQNLYSQKVLEKCGFHLERTFRDHWRKFQEPIEQRQYVLTRDPISEH
jgi:ribosomal-protein-alanine N-acetyltransferase